MRWRCFVVRGSRLLAFGWAVCGFLAAQPLAPPTAAQRTPRASNMNLAGYNDLQARSAYQPTVQKQGERWIAYIGHHGGEQMNPLTGMVEPNGTSIVDVTDPKQPKYLFHIPGEMRSQGPGESGGAQMAATCRAATKVSSTCCAVSVYRRTKYGMSPIRPSPQS